MSLECVSLNEVANCIVIQSVLHPWKTFICIGGRQDGGGREGEGGRKGGRKGGRASKGQLALGGAHDLPQQVRPKSREL